MRHYPENDCLSVLAYAYANQRECPPCRKFRPCASDSILAKIYLFTHLTAAPLIFVLHVARTSSSRRHIIYNAYGSFQKQWGNSKILHAGNLFCYDDVEMYQRYMIFGPFCNTFASLFLEWPIYMHREALFGSWGGFWTWAMIQSMPRHIHIYCSVLVEVPAICDTFEWCYSDLSLPKFHRDSKFSSEFWLNWREILHLRASVAF